MDLVKKKCFSSQKKINRYILPYLMIFIKFIKEILVAVGETDSLIRLAGLDEEKISTEWIFYKKTFKFVNRKRMIVTTTV